MKNELTAKRLQFALSRVNMKAQELSEVSGVNKASISQYINGSHSPSNISAGKMASALQVNPVWLMGFDVPMEIESKSVPSVLLSGDEADLLENYRKLNDEGKTAARTMIKGLVGSGAYSKMEASSISDAG